MIIRVYSNSFYLKDDNIYSVFRSRNISYFVYICFDYRAKLEDGVIFLAPKYITYATMHKIKLSEFTDKQQNEIIDILFPILL